MMQPTENDPESVLIPVEEAILVNNVGIKHQLSFKAEKSLASFIFTAKYLRT